MTENNPGHHYQGVSVIVQSTKKLCPPFNLSFMYLAEDRNGSVLIIDDGFL